VVFDVFIKNLHRPYSSVSFCSLFTANKASNLIDSSAQWPPTPDY